MRESERAFTLLETLITCAIVATLLLAGGFWMMGMHPGALAQATSDYDAALSSARAIATTSTNGATLVFAPIPGRTGFTLRVYEGRPSGSNAVQSTTTMPLTSDAAISDKTLGTPPFSIFLGASGHVSGKASYPTIGATGNATFAAIATEPECPAGGFVLTFTAPSGATATRTLACTSSVASAPGPPNPSPTPNVPIVTPPALVYHWPADARQTFVATEWGYTHWFATTNGFACGSGVASLPNVLPSPYSAAYSLAEANVAPSPPPSTPYSYPNSPESMNDAPATFPLDPVGAGLCNATVADAYGQQAHAAVQVMGWLSATYGGKTFTHLTSPLSLPSSDLPSAGSAVTLPLSKTYDSEALKPAITLDAACSPYVKATASGGTTPGSPSSNAATAGVTLSLVTMPGSKVDCGGTIYDQYPGSLGGEGVAFNATLGNAEIDLWPDITEYPLLGFDIENAGGSVCSKNQPRALDVNQKALTNASPGSGFKSGFSTDANGCIQYNGSDVKQTGSGWDAVSTLVGEPAYSGNFAFATPNSTKLPPAYVTSCSGINFQRAFYSNIGPTAGIQASAESNIAKCSYGVTSSDVATAGNTNTEGVDIVARSCETSGNSIYVPVGLACDVGQAMNDFEACQSSPIGGGGSSPGTFLETNIPSFTNPVSLPSFSDANGDTITDSNGVTPLGTDFFDALGKHGSNYGSTAPTQWTWRFHRVAAGTTTIYLLNYAWNLAPYVSGLNYVCYDGTGGKSTNAGTIIIE